MDLISMKSIRPSRINSISIFCYSIYGNISIQPPDPTNGKKDHFYKTKEMNERLEYEKNLLASRLDE